MIADSTPEMAWLLLVTAVETAAKQWADLSARRLKPTRRFREFVLAFLPDPPAKRPKECYRHKWDTPSLTRSLKKIYKWRSDFVHEGIAFPAPMCMSPYQDQEDKRYSEIPVGLVTVVAGGSWKTSDAPIQLHLFEYIVRGALLEWWKWCLPSIPSLNTASLGELKGIPGIGTNLASNVISYCASHGQYESFDDLRSVAGIGQKTAAAIKTHTTLVKK